MEKRELGNEQEITRAGNPRKPQGEAGIQMLQRMNESHAGVTAWALDFFSFGERDRILDIGCGVGATLRRLSERVQQGHFTGVDYSGVSVQVSGELNAAEIQAGRMEVLEASVEKLPFAQDSFDKIVTVESFYFWPDPAENLKEVLRVLKSGGVFLLVADIYQKEGMKPETQENIARYQMFNPTREEFERLLRQAGFSQVILHTKEGTDWICVEGRKA